MPVGASHVVFRYICIAMTNCEDRLVLHEGNQEQRMVSHAGQERRFLPSCQTVFCCQDGGKKDEVYKEKKNSAGYVCYMA